MIKRIFTTFLSLIAVLSSFALDNATVRLRADRYFSQNEWPSASAFYTLLLEQDKECTDIFGKAIVSSLMIPDTAAVLRFTNDAIDRHVPFKSLFGTVKSESFSIGLENAYENYLILVKDNYAWMTRTIDNSLMEYYTFRKDGKNMIKYAGIMLEGLPENVNFLSTLAQGYLLDGQTEKAVETYAKILNIEPSNYDALLYLGNYYWNINDKAKAKVYFSKAYELRPTPFVKKKLE